MDLDPAILDLIKIASPWEIQQLRAMGMFIPAHWHGKPMESFDARTVETRRRQRRREARLVANRKYRERRAA